MARHLLIRGCKECPKNEKGYCILSKKYLIKEEYHGKFPDHCRLPKIKPNENT